MEELFCHDGLVGAHAATVHAVVGNLEGDLHQRVWRQLLLYDPVLAKVGEFEHLKVHLQGAQE